jgi:hypothetical protein
VSITTSASLSPEMQSLQWIFTELFTVLVQNNPSVGTSSSRTSSFSSDKAQSIKSEETQYSEDQVQEVRTLPIVNIRSNFIPFRSISIKK